MGKIRNHFDTTNENDGFSEADILSLQTKHNITFPEKYLSFLRIAGKKANMLDENQFPNDSKDPLKSISDLQTLFFAQIKKREVELDSRNLWCFSHNKTRKEFYFFYIHNQKELPVSIFGDDIYVDGHEETNGYITKTIDFVDYINGRTRKKYGLSFKKSVLRILIFPVLIILSPIIIPLLIYLHYKTK